MAGEQLRQKLAKTVTRRGVTPALLTAVGVFAALLLYGFLIGVLDTISALGFAAGGLDAGVGGYAATIWSGQLVGSLTGSLPFAIGVFLSLWQLAPIGPELRLAHVVTRALLAAAVGTLCVVVVVVLVSLLGALGGVAWFGNSFPDIGGTLGMLWYAILDGVVRALKSFVEYSATVVLAFVLLWGWLQRHPLAHELGGTLDEV